MIQDIILICKVITYYAVGFYITYLAGHLILELLIKNRRGANERNK